MLNKYFGMVNIKDYPLSKLADFLKFAFEKELYERWLKIYPYMEIGFIGYISFADYKKKIKENVKNKMKNKLLTDKQIIDEGMEIVKMYENQQKRQVENK